MTIYNAYDEFIQSGSSYWSDSSKKYYVKNIGYFLNYLQERYGNGAGQMDISNLPATVLVEYTVWLRAHRRYAGHPMRDRMNVNGTIKNNTVNTYMRAVKAFFNYAYRNKMTQIRFTEGVRLPRSDDDQIVPLSCSEVAAIDSIFDTAVPIDLRNLCIVHLMLDAGLRSSEVIALRPSDIIFASHTLVINRSKCNKSRIVIMSPSLENLMQQYFDVFHPSGTLFRKSTENKAINASVLRSLFLRIVRQTGIDRVHPHLLRHTFATSYILGGGNLETLRILMGHSDYTVTRNYLHLAAQNQITGADVYRLDPIFFKSSY